MKWLKSIVIFAVFVLSIVLIVIGQRNIGPAGLGIMMIGLAGVLVLLFLYNRIYK